MEDNQSEVDRTVRAIVGLLLVGATITEAIGSWGWIGLVPLTTATLGWCPPYRMLGISTSRTHQT